MPNHTIYADISELIKGAKTVILNEDAIAGASTITVKSITGVAINNILFFRDPGNESAEIIATHTAISPTGNTITLASTLVESHPAGTKIYIVRANQVRFYHSSTEADANVSDISLTALATAQPIDPTMVRNLYDDTVQTAGYYYYRFIDSINTINSVYSDPVPWGDITVQYDDNQVGYILEFVRRKLSHEWDERFSKQTAMDEANACLRYIQGKLKRFSRYLVTDYSIGQTALGVFEFDLPVTIYDNETNKSILQVRIGTALNYLLPLDEKEFDAQMQGVVRTQVRTEPVAGAITLNIDNSYDFSDDGSVNVYTDNAVDAITYTGITRSATAGVLTGVPATGSGAIGTNHVIGINVWQGESSGQPRYFNVRNGKMRIWPLPSSTWINKNVVLDFYEEATRVDSEGDTIDTVRYDLVKHWLLWQGKNYWRNNGKSDTKDDDFLLFNDILKSAIRTEVSGQKFKMRPKINNISYGNRRTRYQDI
jgi:hypothetical protein